MSEQVAIQLHVAGEEHLLVARIMFKDETMVIGSVLRAAVDLDPTIRDEFNRLMVKAVDTIVKQIDPELIISHFEEHEVKLQ